MRETTRFLKLGAALAVAGLVAGCTLPAHNNTLIFAVHRKIGVDVTPTTTTSAGITIGYSSNEFAWVPLWANDTDNKPVAECHERKEDQSKTTTPPDKGARPCSKYPKFLGKDAEGKGNGRDEDAYSVFASFGGGASAGAGTDNKADLKIASFFATGIAAQNLAQADPEKLVGADIRSSRSPQTSLRSSLRAYLDVSAEEEKVTEKCVDALKLDKNKFPNISSDVKGRRPDLAADFIARIVLEKAPDQAANTKYRAELLKMQFQDEKSGSSEATARTKICG